MAFLFTKFTPSIMRKKIAYGKALGNQRLGFDSLNSFSYIFKQEKEKRNMNKLKKFVKEHKVELTVAGLAGIGLVGSFAFGYFLGRDDSKAKSIIESVADEKVDEIVDKCNLAVDEDIFTSLAPEIENLVLSDDTDEGLIKRTYDVKCPKYGDWGNGSYTIAKKVSVLVRDMGEKEF